MSNPHQEKMRVLTTTYGIRAEPENSHASRLGYPSGNETTKQYTGVFSRPQDCMTVEELIYGEGKLTVSFEYFILEAAKWPPFRTADDGFRIERLADAANRRLAGLENSATAQDVYTILLNDIARRRAQAQSWSERGQNHQSEYVPSVTSPETSVWAAQDNSIVDLCSYVKERERQQRPSTRGYIRWSEAEKSYLLELATNPKYQHQEQTRFQGKPDLRAITKELNRKFHGQERVRYRNTVGSTLFALKQQGKKSESSPNEIWGF